MTSVSPVRVEDVATDGGGRGPAVLDLSAILLGPEKRPVEVLEIAEGDDGRRRQIETSQDSSDSISMQKIQR